MNFASDNWSGVAPQISSALAACSSANGAAYGDSELDKKVKQKFSEIFEKQVEVFFVGTGTIANALALALLSKPGGISLCHREAHMIEDECGAPELFSGGGRLVGVDGNFGKMDMDDLDAKINRFDPDFVHYGQPAAISITQATEAGTVYSTDEIAAICARAKKSGLPVHMDGSRIANALVASNATPAQMTWKSGIDILSFGGTKNGCWCAEALILFHPSQADQMAYIHKRAGQLFSKSRFIAAQYDAYLQDSLWLKLAEHANNMADNLRKAISQSVCARLGWETRSNEVFCVLSDEKAEALRKTGASFYPWHTPAAMRDKPENGESLYRFVTNFSTRQSEIDQAVETICK